MKMQSPYEFNVHTFVVYDYLGIVVLHFINPWNLSSFQVKFNVHFIYLVLIITMWSCKHNLPIFYNIFGLQLFASTHEFMCLFHS
jgi:hypothetical protein